MKKDENLTLERPSDGKEVTMRIRPFKARRDKLPFKKGQGVSISGWQFQIRTIQANGTIYLKPIGRIMEVNDV